MKPVLSISILTSRNEREVRRCLESLTPLREQLDCELILVDTSGGDEATSALCREFGDKVIEFEWCGDFSAARNAGLSLATGEWFMYIDDDEWLLDVGEIVDFFKSGMYADFGGANYIQRNFSDEGLMFYNDAWGSRLIRLCPDTRFHGKVHEFMFPQLGKNKNLYGTVAGHSGYISQTEDDRLRKFERNYPLLLEMIREEPHLLRWRVQTIQELHNVRRWEDEKKLCLESLGMTTGLSSRTDIRDIGTFYGGLVESLAWMGDVETAANIGEAAMVDARMNRMCHGYIAMTLGRAFFQKRNWAKAREQLDRYHEVVEYYEQNPAAKADEMGGLLLGLIFDEIPQQHAFALEAAAALMLGDVSVLEKNFDRMGLEQPQAFLADGLMPALSEAESRFPENRLLSQAMAELCRNEDIARKYPEMAEKNKKLNDDLIKKQSGGAKPLLSISMLASRSGREIRRCLESLTPLREQLPCELIIVDTSGGDAETSALCHEFADKVVEFEWCDDFSAARNAGLELARGEWFLYIDDDEWFEDVTPLVDFFKSGTYKGYGCANYIQRNYHDNQLAFYGDTWVSRMIKLGKDTRFFSRIHEYAGPQYGQCINLNVIANHTGYIMQDEEDKKRKFDRNYPLLLDMIRSEPDELRWRVQAVQELHNVKHWEDERKLCRESLDISKKRTSPTDVRDVGTFYGGLVESLAWLGDEAGALKAAEEARADKRMAPVCHAYDALALAQMYFRMRRWDETKEQLAAYRKSMAYYDDNPKAVQRDSSALLLYTLLSDDVPKKRAISLELGCALMQGDMEAFEKNYGELGWDKPTIYVSDELFPMLIEAMATLPAHPALDRAMQDLWNNPKGAPRVFSEIESYRKKDGTAFWRLLGMTARMEGDFWYIYYAKIMSADHEGADADYTELFKGFCIRTPSILMTPSEISDAVRRRGGSLDEGYRSVPFDKWKDALLDYAENAPLSDFGTKEKELEEAREQDDLRYDYALMCLSRAKAMKARDYMTLSAALMKYGERAFSFAGAYFTQEVTEEYPELLPDEVYCGVCIWLAFLQRAENSREEVAYFDLATKRDKALSSPILAFMQLREADKKKKSASKEDEMRQLEDKIKSKVKKCLDGAKFSDALEILEQLKQIKPNDLDVAKMSLEAWLGIMG